MASSNADARDTVWRVTAVGRFGAVAISVVWLALAVGFTVGNEPSVVLLWVAFAAIMIGAWRWAFVPFIALTDTGVVIQNRLLRATVAYADIAAVQPGYSGLTITRRSGGSVTAWAVQKTNMKRWQGREDTRADQVAGAIRARAGLEA